MKQLNKTHAALSTILAFALIPLSGFATDIYLPSFPAMARFFGTSQADIQLSLVVFIVSSGIGQLFVGSLVDSFGRYRLTLWALFIFAITCFAIAVSNSITIVLTMRVIQGLTVALIVVSKRAFILDLYSGEKLKHYTSLFSIIWAMAPIVAPFLGGFLHHYFGWQSNFYFLGSVALVLIMLELLYSGETTKEFHSFNFKSLLHAYSTKLTTPDFALTLVILGLTYSMVMIYNMASPFIIEQVFHRSAVVTGNTSLLSGLAILVGALISKATIHKPIVNKITTAAPLLIILPMLLMSSMLYFPSLNLMITIVFLLHVVSGFTFNTFYAYAFGRFSTHSGIVSGLTGGGLYIITSIVSYTIVGALNMKTPVMLGIGYSIITVLIVVSFFVFAQLKRRIVFGQNFISDTKALAS
jgi:MFS transporter, DHA1 family, multidrug resistance protein